MQLIPSSLSLSSLTRQEAIKILDMAGLQLSSPESTQIMRDAGLSDEVVQGVLKLGEAPVLPQLVTEQLGELPGAEGGLSGEERSLDDPLDGLELDLSSLLEQLGDEQGRAQISVSETIVEGIESASTRERQAQGDPLLLNDIEAESHPRSRLALAPMPGDQQPLSLALSPEPSTSTAQQSSAAVCTCQRCFRLEQYGQVEEALRPGWSEHELLTPTRFEELLSVIKDSRGVVLCLVDVFDLSGSIVRNLKHIAGDNPIVIAANKADLLPTDTSLPRVRAWLHNTLKQRCGLKSPRDAEQERFEERAEFGWNREAEEVGVLRRENVHLVSCASGMGIDALMNSLLSLAEAHGEKVFVMGAANVGKSSFINRLLETDFKTKPKKGGQKRSSTPKATVSNLPGTTLNFLKIRLPPRGSSNTGITMVDTPGLLKPGQLTARLTPAELRQVIPSKPVLAVTLRLAEGKSLLLGGLAQLDLVEGRPFFFTSYVSNEVKLHPTSTEGASDFLEKHTGSLAFPPESPERRAALGPFESREFRVQGAGWKRAAVDVVICGLGWVTITGAGDCRVRVTVPKGVELELREPLMPFDVRTVLCYLCTYICISVCVFFSLLHFACCPSCSRSGRSTGSFSLCLMTPNPLSFSAY
jgi:ribosome biogenesis GTPase A